MAFVKNTRAEKYEVVESDGRKIASLGEAEVRPVIKRGKPTGEVDITIALPPRDADG